MKKRAGLRITEELGLPRYLVYDLPLVCLEGTETATVQNGGRLRVVRPERVEIERKGFVVSVEGDGLQIRSTDGVDTEIGGQIRSVSVQRKETT